MGELRKLRDSFMQKIKEDKKEKKYIAIFMAVVLLIVVLMFSALGFSIWEEYKKTIIDNQKKQMLLTAQSLGDNLEIFIEEYEADLNALCTMESENRWIGGHEEWDILQGYVDSHERFVYDVIVEETDGTVIKSTKGRRLRKFFRSLRLTTA